MLPLGGPISEFLAAFGTVIGGGAAIGSLLGGAVALAIRRQRSYVVEVAALAALLAGCLAAGTLVFEELTGLP